MRTEANSHQMVYNETMKKSRQKAKTFNIGDCQHQNDKVDKTQLHPNVLIGKF